MTHPKVAMFLQARDRAYARGDVGVIRSLNADLRRLGVPDDATLAHPAGRRPSRAPTVPDAVEVTPSAAKGKASPRQMRCEHENVAERCPECNPELAAK